MYTIWNKPEVEAFVEGQLAEITRSLVDIMGSSIIQMAQLG